MTLSVALSPLSLLKSPFSFPLQVKLLLRLTVRLVLRTRKLVAALDLVQLIHQLLKLLRSRIAGMLKHFEFGGLIQEWP